MMHCLSIVQIPLILILQAWQANKYTFYLKERLVSSMKKKKGEMLIKSRSTSQNGRMIISFFYYSHGLPFKKG
jgi:hypothetical protein